MKVRFYKNIKTMSGRDKPANLVFLSMKNHSVCVVREYVKPRNTEHNHVMGARMKVVASLWKHISIDFIRDLKVYAASYNSQHLAEDKLPLFAYQVFSMAVLKTAIPLSNISVLAATFGDTLTEWIDAGFLPKITTSYSFSASVE
ncbi:MAG: hypothetical protein FWG20_02620 [Candidatus Cloacimonetes bacterium]|nr:hypothetical protein [Candidatus Cloacimonadota bacterium]